MCYFLQIIAAADGLLLTVTILPHVGAKLVLSTSEVSGSINLILYNVDDNSQHTSGRIMYITLRRPANIEFIVLGEQ